MSASMPPPPSAFSAPKDVQTVMPSAVDAGKSISVSGFKVTTRKLPILNAPEIDAMTEKLGITPPEMIFGNNLVSVEKITESEGSEDQWKIEFNALDALDLVDKTGNDMLKVAYSGEWQKQR
ncbi:hypothetical protein ABW20_dc0107697 [Dactylellina cionopaga]|nr:hypothetical protein ABW20_dc0107697 [Dactylellina cionopaga]